ncbi:thioredoxin domain-containing protein [Thiomicrorhabdus sp. Milos-T2]|uniref:thioredoxin domain-containing protein n=1 Tax=Thiomicrorhabdus sp. Milos-T2 TaxID=90814 RepID=UPI0006924786|nr:DUF255 domain-containing protein [Thiomicrorhabdus sp. Milos-T2]
MHVLKLPGLVALFTLTPILSASAQISQSPLNPNVSETSQNLVQTSANQNQLNNHPSPYLAMHGQDPVNWKLWGKSILKQAQQENKLVFISSGYFACHWCHVMQKENYHNLATANYLNQHFISVKIDRELNPELDKTLIEFAQKTTGQAGWPQHVILTPQGYPFVAFIYLPNPSFNKTLKRIVELWQKQPNQITQLAKLASQNQSSKTPTEQPLMITQKSLQQRLFKQLNQLKDDFSGGLKGTSKFPEAPLLNALLKIHSLPSDIEEWLITTLDHMQTEHLFDHIHGGFYRYTVDPNWQTPHFEKMAYDNALLVNTYLMAGKRFNREDYLKTAQKTLSYLQTHLYSKKTQLFQSSQSAINKLAQEGGDYLWSKTQLKQTLSKKEYQFIYQAWSLNETPPYELGWHPMPIQSKADWENIKIKLQTPKQQIPVDSKSILGWNGLLLSSFSQAWQVLNKPEYQTYATRLATKLSTLILQSSPPRALAKNGEPIGEANLQDYAFILKGLEDYQLFTQDHRFNQAVTKLKNLIPQKFYTNNSWQYGATKILPQQKGESIMVDGPIPSPAALVSCLKPKSITPQQDKLLAQAINYPSYLETLNCIHNTVNPVK